MTRLIALCVLFLMSVIARMPSWCWVRSSRFRVDGRVIRRIITHKPEIYHYRFTEPQGFGFGQTGNDNGEGDVVTIKHNSTLKVMYDLVHSQVAAPGYGMYYIWVIRHLDDCQYTVPTF